MGFNSYKSSLLSAFGFWKAVSEKSGFSCQMKIKGFGQILYQEHESLTSVLTTLDARGCLWEVSLWVCGHAYPCRVSISLGVFYKEKCQLFGSHSKTSRMQQSLKLQEKIPWEGKGSIWISAALPRVQDPRCWVCPKVFELWPFTAWIYCFVIFS